MAECRLIKVDRNDEFGKYSNIPEGEYISMLIKIQTMHMTVVKMKQRHFYLRKWMQISKDVTNFRTCTKHNHRRKSDST